MLVKFLGSEHGRLIAVHNGSIYDFETRRCTTCGDIGSFLTGPVPERVSMRKCRCTQGSVLPDKSAY